MRRTLSLTIALGLAAAAFAWQQGAVNQLQQDGKTVSTNLRVVDGTLMVSAKDVASYLGGDLQIANGTATVIAKRPNEQAGGPPDQAGSSPIVVPGTTGSSGATTGSMGVQTMPSFQPTVPNYSERKRPDPKELTTKLGQVADVDGFQLWATTLETLKGDYRTELDPRGRRIGKSLPGDQLVVVRMKIENGTERTQRPPVPSALNVTLFDDRGVGVPVIAFDARPSANDVAFSSDLAPYNDLDAPILAPKGAYEFNAVFSLPKDRMPNRLTIALPGTNADSGGANVTVELQ